MFGSIALLPSVLGLIVVISLVIAKYFNNAALFLVLVVLASILYQRDRNRRQNRTDNFEETLVNVSIFIIVSGISGYLVVRIVGLFLPGFN
jgi:integral membrane sensor domain MASE1